MIILKITVKLFAGLAELVGQREISVDVEPASSIAHLKAAVMTAVPDAAAQVAHALVALNRRYASDNDTLTETDEIAFIPPVGGGSEETDSNWYSRITECPLDVGAAFRALEDVHCGGTVLFVGTVREWTKGRQTVRLEYEAYQDMAIAQMERIHAEVREQYPGTLTLMWHRIGHLEPTDVAVVCAAASPHRDTAFTAARILIERLKKEVPIWKREQYADGETVWQPNEV